MAGMKITCTNGVNRQAVAQSLVGHHSRAATHRFRQAALCAASMLAVTGPIVLLGGAAAQAHTPAPHLLTNSFTPLTLQKGWTDSPFGTSAAAVRTISGIVHLKGAIATTGTNPVPFTLPASFRPASVVFVPVDLCNATNGRLQIEPTGVVSVQAEGGAFSNAGASPH